MIPHTMLPSVTTIDHLDALPIGSVIAHDSPLNGLEVALRSGIGWEVSGQSTPRPSADMADWIGADILGQRGDIVAIMERLQAMAARLAASVKQPAVTR